MGKLVEICHWKEKHLLHNTNSREFHFIMTVVYNTIKPHTNTNNNTTTSTHLEDTTTVFDRLGSIQITADNYNYNLNYNYNTTAFNMGFDKVSTSSTTNTTNTKTNSTSNSSQKILHQIPCLEVSFTTIVPIIVRIMVLTQQIKAKITVR